MFNRVKCRLLLALAVGLLAAAPTPVAAQTNDPSVQEGNIELADQSQPILEYALGAGFLLAAMAIGFKPSKRSETEGKTRS